MRWFSFFALAPLCACASSTGDARQLDAGFFRGDADVLGDTSVPVRTDAGLYPLQVVPTFGAGFASQYVEARAERQVQAVNKGKIRDVKLD